jgi:hypothetical protein
MDRMYQQLLGGVQTARVYEDPALQARGTGQQQQQQEEERWW